MSIIDLFEDARFLFNFAQTLGEERITYIENKLYLGKLKNDVVVVIKADSYTDAQETVRRLINEQ